MAGIDREIQTRMDAANNDPQVAMQRFGNSQSVLDLISAQLLANQNAEANNAIKAMFTGSNQTELQRLNQQNAISARNDTISAIMPGVAQKAARDQQAMQRQAMGIPSQPAPNMRMADGGIVGFSVGGMGKGDRPTAQGQPSAASQDAEAKDIDNYIKAYRDYEASLANAPTAEEKQDVEARFKISQQSFGSDVRTKAHQKMSAESSMKGMDDFQGGGVVALGEGGVLSFGNGGGIGQAYLDPETGEPLGGFDRIKRLFQGITGQLTAEDLYQNPDAMTREELDNFPSPAEIRRARYNVPEAERLSPQELNTMNQEERRERLVNRALRRRGEQTPEKTAGIAGTMPDVFNVASMVENLGKPQEESEEFRMKGVTDAGKQEEPVARRGLAGLLDKIEKNADMNRLRAFLRGGAGQTSVANALAAADRGLAAEDLRQRQLDIQETDVLGRIAASRYGSELDYRAALANLRQDEREMIYKADRELEKQYLGAEQDAAKTFLADLDDSELFSSQFMRLQQEFEGAQLAAETAALRERLLDDYMNSYRRSGLGVSTGTFGYTAPSE
tara:strand:+ start:1479 stop:3161 length:1683 start_codon:yes stop_codon:yes gene_type:complete